MNAATPLAGALSRAQAPATASRPEPLIRRAEPQAPYPMDALGEILAPAARAIAQQVQVPPALAANSVLASAALVAQSHCNVDTLGGDRPLSLFVLTVAESGDRKSSADRIALAAVHEYTRDLAREYREQMADFEARDAAHRESVKRAKGAKNRPADEIAATLRELEAPARPRDPSVLCSDPTPEGLLKSLRDGQLAQGLFSDGGGTLIGGHAMSRESELRTIGTLARLWDGSALDRVRAGDESRVTLYGRRLSVHLMAQPVVARRLLGSPLYRGQGFVARFLVAAPESLAGTRFHDGVRRDPKSDPAVRVLYAAQSRLLALAPSEDESLGGLRPRFLSLAPAAWDALTEEANAIERQLAPGGRHARNKEFAAKAAEHACRIAGVLALVGNPLANEVSEPAMRDALALARWYLEEQRRLAGSADESTNRAVELLDWLRARGPQAGWEWRRREVQNAGPYALREGAELDAALGLLESRGWVIRSGGSISVPSLARDADIAE